MKKFVIKSFIFISAMVGVFILNYGFLDSFIIPDPCYYHTNDTTFIFDLFYCFPSVEAGHPFPSVLNILLTLITGLFLGFFFNKMLFPSNKL